VEINHGNTEVTENTKLIILFSALILSATFSQAQNFTTQEPFHLINIGNGAAALGMGGAYVAIADDLSALTWNPAGLSNKTGFRMQFDSAYTNGSEDFEVTTRLSGTSNHDFSVSGFQPQSIALTYQIQRGDTVFGPAFSWNRSTLSLHDYNMDAPATGEYHSPILIISADYSEIYNRTFDRPAEDIYSFGFSFKKNRLAIGGTWNVLAGESTDTLVIHQTQNGVQQVFTPDGEPDSAPFSLTNDVTHDWKKKYSGSYLSVGTLYEVNKKISVGGFVRFGYTRKVDTNELIKVDFDFSGPIPFSDHRISELDPSTLESKIPIEVSGGLAVHLNTRLLIASSLTFADYRMNGFQSEFLFPTDQRAAYGHQSALIQWRNGLEFQANESMKVRGGVVIDDQPYSLNFYPVNEPDDSPFYGFTLGGGWNYQKIGFDVAFLHENGKALFGERLGGHLDGDAEFSEGHLSHNRFFFSMKLQH
jgi:long-subunit fatty acid transport protein